LTVAKPPWEVLRYKVTCFVPPLPELIKAFKNYTHTFNCFIALGASELNRGRVILADYCNELIRDGHDPL